MSIRIHFALAVLIGTSLPAYTAAQSGPQLSSLALSTGDPSTTPNNLVSQLLDPNSDFTIWSPGITIHIKNHQVALTDDEAIGIFAGGNVPAGTSMNEAVDPNAVFSGGIGIESGVCLSTGRLSDGRPPEEPPTPWGVEGANNGVAFDVPVNPGEVSKILQEGEVLHDEDFQAVYPPETFTPGGDPAVLEFQIDVHSPGFLRVSFVFGSDEFPAWYGSFNDTFAILIKSASTPPDSPGENLATFVDAGVTKNFSLLDLVNCATIFRKNQMSPQALELNPDSLHKITNPANYYTFYDHEFGGFSAVLTRETKKPLALGRYTVKFVMEDVLDQKVDSALFLAAHSVKLFAFANGDYNCNGCVDGADYVVWRNNLGMSPATFSDGDGDADGVVDSDDYWVWRNNLGNSGMRDFRADFDRDGDVDFGDFGILSSHWQMPKCASRFEGDADGDGDVDSGDFSILAGEYGLTSCGCSCGGGGGGEMMAGNGGDSSSALETSPPENPDLNGDGAVDEKDLVELDQIVLGMDLETYTEQEAAKASENVPPEVPLPELTLVPVPDGSVPQPAPTPAISSR